MIVIEIVIINISIPLKKCEYDIQRTKNSNIELFNITISDENMGFCALNKKLKLAREKGYIFNQILKLTIKIYSNLSNINICYYLKFRLPIMHRPFFKILSQNREYIQTHCNFWKMLFILHVINGIYIIIDNDVVVY